MAQTKPGRAARRKSRDRASLAKMAGLVATLLLLASGYLWLIGAGTPPRIAAIGGPFQLVQADGHVVTDRSFPGKYLLIYFGYTFCPDVCPTTLAKMAAALDKLGAKADRVQPLFITIDPKRDTPAVIGRYTAAFSPRLLGLTGTAEQIATVEKEYRVYAAVHRTGSGPNDYTMDHSGIVYLMGPNGHFVAVVRADADADAMAVDIAKKLS